MVHLRHIHIDCCRLEVFKVVIEADEEEAVVHVESMVSLFEQILLPKVTLVAPFTVVGFLAPRVAKLDETHAFRVDECFVDGVSVVVRNSHFVLVLVTTCAGKGARSYHCVLFKVGHDLFPARLSLSCCASSRWWVSRSYD